MSIVLYEVAGAGDMRPSPYCWRIRWALRHKGLEFTTVPLGYTEISALADGRYSRLPVLEHDGEMRNESFEIARYLDAAFPDRPLLFAAGVASAAFYDGWTEAAIHGPAFCPVVQDMHDRLRPADQDYFRASREKALGQGLAEASAGRDAALAPFRAGLAPLRAALAQAPFLGGAAPDYGDYIVASGFRWIEQVSEWPALEADDPVSHWLERIRSLRG